MDLLLKIWDKVETLLAYVLASVVVSGFIFAGFVAWAMLEELNIFLERFL